MSLATNITNLATRISTEVKGLRTLINGNAADLASLETTAKSNLVDAVNEVKGIAEAAAGGGVSINDSATNTTQTWSSQKITDEKPTWSTIAEKPAVIGAGATAADARSEIGAGTSNLAIGTTASTAAAGNRAASTTATGMVELATNAETTTGTDSTRAVTPAGVKAVSDTLAPLSHNHTAANVTDFTSAVDARIALTVDAAPAALDTLNELAAALGDDPNFSSTITTALGNRVRVDASQSFTGPQQAQGRSNIDAASATDVGNTATDFVAAFEAGLV